MDAIAGTMECASAHRRDASGTAVRFAALNAPHPILKSFKPFTAIYAFSPGERREPLASPSRRQDSSSALSGIGCPENEVLDIPEDSESVAIAWATVAWSAACVSRWQRKES